MDQFRHTASLVHLLHLDHLPRSKHCLIPVHLLHPVQQVRLLCAECCCRRSVCPRRPRLGTRVVVDDTRALLRGYTSSFAHSTGIGRRNE